MVIVVRSAKDKKLKRPAKDPDQMREEILKSMVALLRIEGINISEADAAAALKKVSLSSEK